MSRRPILAGNWKMNLLRPDASAFCQALSSSLTGALGGEEPAVDILLFPPSLLIDTVVRGVAGTSIGVGGQDVHEAASGAHTGDTSAAQLREAGCTWALCGHSERRRDHGETDSRVGQKALAASNSGLDPLVCVGETLAERQAGATQEVLERQVRAVLAAGAQRLTFAYEPVWAIGTGDSATPETAQESHAFLRQVLRDELGDQRAEEIRLLYGGSAKPDNVAQLFVQPDIDGFLVGGASLDSASFWAMISACAGN